jgi:hypothetical protein
MLAEATAQAGHAVQPALARRNLTATVVDVADLCAKTAG